MAKNNLTFVKNEKEHREMYRSSFRNIDTDLGFYNYSDKGELLAKNLGFISGSKVLFTGESYSGKSTLCCNIVSDLMRPFVKNGDPIILHIVDTERGVNQSRFRHLSKFTDQQLNDYVVFHDDISLDNLKAIIDYDITMKRDKNYVKRKTKNTFGEEVEIYYPTFIIVDAMSEMVSRDALEIGAKDHKAFSAKKGLDMHIFWQKYTSYFAQYNINIFMTAHIADDIQMNAMPRFTPSRKFTGRGMAADKKVSGGKNLTFQSDIQMHLNKFIVYSEKHAEGKSLDWLESAHIVEASFQKTRQNKPNIPFTLVLDGEFGYNPMKSFLCECVMTGVIETVGGFRQLEGWDKKFRASELLDLFQTEPKFRELLYKKYEESKKDILESMKRDEEQLKRVNDILDFMYE